MSYIFLKIQELITEKPDYCLILRYKIGFRELGGGQTPTKFRMKLRNVFKLLKSISNGAILSLNN